MVPGREVDRTFTDTLRMVGRCITRDYRISPPSLKTTDSLRESRSVGTANCNAERIFSLYCASSATSTFTFDFSKGMSAGHVWGTRPRYFRPV